MSTPQTDPITVADLEKARNAALECAAWAGSAAYWLVGGIHIVGSPRRTDKQDMGAFARRSSHVIRGGPAIERVSRLLAGESMVTVAGMCCPSYHKAALELAHQVHSAPGKSYQMLDAAGRKPPWPAELVEATLHSVLVQQLEWRMQPDAFTELCDGIRYEYDRGLNRLAAAGEKSPPYLPKSDLDVMREAIQALGDDGKIAKPNTLIKGRIGEQRGRAARRELERIGEYEGFQRAKPR